MSSSRRRGNSARDDLRPDIDSLLQVVYEIEGLKKLEDLVPDEVLWVRPPGLPSGIELLWLVHLVDRHVFIPSAGSIGSADLDTPEPDYAALLAADPCSIDTIEDLLAEVAATRRDLITVLRGTMSEDSTSGNVQLLVDTVLAHDRNVLSALTERLYESGLGA